MLTYQGNIITKHTDVNNWINATITGEWVKINEPTNNTYARVVTGWTNNSEMLYTTWVEVNPDWLSWEPRLEVRGKVEDGVTHSGSSSFCETTDNEGLYILNDGVHNKYYLFDLYGWYYCEGVNSSTVHLDNGLLQLSIKPQWGNTYEVFKVNLTPSNIYKNPARYNENTTNTITYTNGQQDVFSFPPNRLINFKCLLDMETMRVYNVAIYADETYSPCGNISGLTWNYYGTLAANSPSKQSQLRNAILNNYYRVYLQGTAGQFYTGITSWFQSGITWSNLAIYGCSIPNLYINYR
jgi:hypothetical protein